MSNDAANAAKAVWFDNAIGLLHEAKIKLSDQGVWANLHALYAQGLTPGEAVAKLPTLLPRLAKS